MAADTATNCTLGTGYDNTIMYNNHMNGSLKTRLTTAKKYASIDTTLTLFGKGGGRAMWPAGCNIKQEWCFGDIGGMRDGLRDGRLCRSMDTTQGWTTFNLMDGEEGNWNNNWVVTQSVEKQGLKMRREEAVQQLTANNLLHQKGAIPAPPPKPPWPPPWHDEEPISEQICMEDAALVRHKYNWRCTQQSRPFVALSHNNNTSGYSPFRVVNWMTSTVEVVLQNHNNSDNILENCFGDIGGMRDGLRDGRLCRSMDTTQGWTTFNLMDGEEGNWNNNWVVTQSVEKQGLKMRREEAVQQLTANNLLHQKGAIPAPPPKPPWPPPWHDEEPISEQICMEDAALVRHKYNWRCTQQSRPFVALSHNNNTSGYSPFRVVNWMTSTVEVVLQNHNNSDNILENGNTYCGEDSDVCSIYTKFILHNRGSESFLVRLVSNDCVDVSVSQAEAALSQAPPSDIGVVGPMV